MIVRAAASGDAAAVVAVIHAAFEEYRGKLRPESAALAETEATVARQLAGHGGFVAEVDGRMVGAVLYELRPGAIYFGRLAVPPAARGRGIASMLLRAIEEEGRRRGVARVTMGVRIELPGNAAFFERHGYREVGRTPPPGSTTPFLIDMARTLADAE